MTVEYEYRRYAAEATALAEKAINPSDKEAWLRIAQSWMKLVEPADPPSKKSAK
jgi:hypothetical protein